MKFYAANLPIQSHIQVFAWFKLSRYNIVKVNA